MTSVVLFLRTRTFSSTIVYYGTHFLLLKDHHSFRLEAQAKPPEHTWKEITQHRKWFDLEAHELDWLACIAPVKTPFVCRFTKPPQDWLTRLQVVPLSKLAFNHLNLHQEYLPENTELLSNLLS